MRTLRGKIDTIHDSRLTIHDYRSPVDVGDHQIKGAHYGDEVADLGALSHMVECREV